FLGGHPETPPLNGWWGLTGLRRLGERSLSRRDGPTVTVPLAQLRDLLAPQGLNLIGAAEVARYDAIVPPRHAVGSRAPDARTLVVIGNGGGAFWEAFRCYREREALAGHQPAPLAPFTPPPLMHPAPPPPLPLAAP